MEILNSLIVVLLASGAVGMAVTFLIQLGKLFIPKWFPDGSADNWRLGLVLLTAVGVMITRLAGYPLSVEAIEAAAVQLTLLGTTLMPLLVLFANWISKSTYTQMLKGVWKIGFSHSEY